MTRTKRSLPHPRHVAAALLAGLVLPGAAHAAPVVEAAPGRVVVQVDDGAVRKDVDANGGGPLVALPDRGVLALVPGSPRGPLHAVKLGPSGVPDETFGTAGVRTVELPAHARFNNLLQVLRQPDGKLLLIGANTYSSTTTPPRLLVARLSADLALDGSYGVAGVATAPVGEGCGACTTGALQADGSLVLAGTTGNYADPTETPLALPPSRLRWSIARLTPTGALDRSFGAGGITTIATATAAFGYNVAIGPAGTIVAEGATDTGGLDQAKSRLLLTRLLPTGAPDPSFAGGTPVSVPLASGFLMQVGADGSVLVSGEPARTGPATPATLGVLSRHYLIRYTAVGRPDSAFGSGGVVDLGTAVQPTQLLAAGPRELLVVGTPAYALAPGMAPVPGRLIARLVAADGALDAARTVDLPFGGGYSSFLVSIRPRRVPRLSQSTFTGTAVVRRSDGSFVAPGGIRVSQPTGEGTGFSIGRFAAAGLTPAFALDPSFGGAAEPLELSVRLPRQRAITARARHGIRIAVKSSAVGLARVTIAHGGRAIARSLVPIFKTTRHTLPIALTRYGNSYLRRHRDVSVSVTAQGRDLLTNATRAGASGRLR